MSIKHFGTCQNEEVLLILALDSGYITYQFLMLCMAATFIIEVDNTII